MKQHQRLIYLSILVTSLGIIFATVLSDTSGGLGTVFIALGGFLLIAGMSEKRRHDQQEDETPHGNSLDEDSRSLE